MHIASYLWGVFWQERKFVITFYISWATWKIVSFSSFLVPGILSVSLWVNNIIMINKIIMIIMMVDNRP